MSIALEPGSGLILYSSRTGNTKYLAEGISAGLSQPHRLLSVGDYDEGLGPAWILFGYWVDRGTADAKALAVLESMHGQNLGLFGTLGAYPDSAHAADVHERLQTLVAKQNRCLGSFLCQGQVDPALIEKFKQFPPEHPHALNAERRKRHADAASHPDEQDVSKALAACKAMLDQLELV